LHLCSSFLALLLLSCASAPTTPAPWAASPAAIRSVFPDSQYIAQRGRGKTRQAAEAQGASELARFISSQITASKGYRISSGTGGETLDTEDEAYVRAQINLFGIRYAEDAFYNKSAKEWQTVAYIERAETWPVYSPGFKRQADSFTALYTAAEGEADPFKKVLRLKAAEQFSHTEEFENASLFGQILYPEKMNAEFAGVRTRLAALPQKLDDARRNASVYINCPVDFESLISNAFASRFAAQGFPVSKTRSAAAAVCTITVDEGMQKRDIGTFYFPSLQAVVSGRSGALFTFSAKGEQASAVTPDVAKRRAYTNLAAEVEKTFTIETVQ
jgi:hypothetical protein